MLLFLSLPFAMANHPSEVLLEQKRQAVNLHVPSQVITFDADRINRLGTAMPLGSTLMLVPGAGRHLGTLSGHSRGDVAIMLDGVVLREEKRLGPLP